MSSDKDRCAARYLWLRDCANTGPVALIFDTEHFGADVPKGTQIDKAIDAEMINSPLPVVPETQALTGETPRTAQALKDALAKCEALPDSSPAKPLIEALLETVVECSQKLERELAASRLECAEIRRVNIAMREGAVSASGRSEAAHHRVLHELGVERNHRINAELDRDAHKARLAETEIERERRLREALLPLANIPLEEFGYENLLEKQIVGWNRHNIYVKDVIFARAALKDEP